MEAIVKIEMLHINNIKPQLNIQKSSKLFSLIIGTQEDSDATRTLRPKFLSDHNRLIKYIK